MIIKPNGHIMAVFPSIRDRLKVEQGGNQLSCLPDVTVAELVDRLKVAKSSLSAGYHQRATSVIDALLDELASHRRRP